jgi:hypothetical protein
MLPSFSSARELSHRPGGPRASGVFVTPRTPWSTPPREEPLERVDPIEDTSDGADRREGVVDLAGVALGAPLVFLGVFGRDRVSFGRRVERRRRGGPHLAVPVKNILASDAEFAVVQPAMRSSSSSSARCCSV